jgi:hypothetical protein
MIPPTSDQSNVGCPPSRTGISQVAMPGFGGRCMWKTYAVLVGCLARFFSWAHHKEEIRTVHEGIG